MTDALLDLVFRMAGSAPRGARWRIDPDTLGALVELSGGNRDTDIRRWTSMLDMPIEIAEAPCLRLVVTA